MPVIAYIEFVGYREWTESLGNDREWFIQLTQAKNYQVIQNYVASLGGLALPLRFDYQLAILPEDINKEAFVKGLVKALEHYAPTPVNIHIFCGKIKEVVEGLGKPAVLNTCVSEPLVVAHADLNYFTEMTKGLGVYRSYVEVMKLVHTYVMKFYKTAITQYLGGDNLVVIADLENLDDVINTLIETDGIKVGVGISKNPRKAFALAAEALSKIRGGNRAVKYVIRLDEGFKEVLHHQL